MNGSVTLEIISVAVDAPDFASAKAKLKARMVGIGSVRVNCDNDELFDYFVTGPSTVIGTMKNKQLMVI